MLDIKPISDPILNCVDNALISVVSWYGRRYEMIYSDTWSFDFIDAVDNETIGSRLFSGNRTTIDFIKDYCNVNAIQHSMNDINDFFNIIISELNNNKPVLMRAGSKNYPRALLVVGFNEKEKGIYYLEPAISTDTEPFYFDTDKFNTIREQYLTFNVEDYKGFNIDSEGFMNHLENTALNLLNSDMFNKIKKFSGALKNIDLIVKEFKQSDDANDMRLVEEPHVIGIGRKKFAYFIEHFSNKFNTPGLLQISNSLTEVGDKWEIVRALLTKMLFITNKQDVADIIVNKVSSLAEEEEKIASELLDLCIKGNLKANKININKNMSNCNDTKNLSINNYYYVDLSTIFNNKGFGSIDEAADFDNNNYFFLRNGLPDDSRIDIDKISFKVKNCINEMDNVFCLNQTVTVQKRTYSSIMLLGCTENGNYTGELEIIYDDNSTQIIPVRFTDWWSSFPIYNEKIAWSGNCARLKDGEFSAMPNNVSLFAQIFKVDNNKKICKIKLPESPNIHIFAITLGS